ncbi:MAG: hypothetical protein NVS9B7_05840 [Flavisolibacter sp.]
MPGVIGRIDHMDVNLKSGIVYVAALGNNSLEIVDLAKGKVLHSIKGLDEPQGVAYIPQKQEIIVANGGNGDCYFYNAHTFEKTGTLHLGSDADDIHYDSASQLIYVGYGNGGISVIDALKHQPIGNIKLPAHPENFQLDQKLEELFVNVPDAQMIAVIDLAHSRLLTQWSTGSLRANFPMAIDPVNHYVFVGYRHPAKLVVLDGKMGGQSSSSDMAGDVDDLFFEGKNAMIYASGGSGYISIYKWQEKNLKQVANIATKAGARTSLLIPQLNIFISAERLSSNSPAQLKLYRTN